MSREDPLERTLKSNVERLLRSMRRCWWLKFHGYRFMSLGAPDFLVVVADRDADDCEAIIVFVELKRIGREPTRIQREVHRALRRCGANVFVASTVEEFKQCLVSAGLHPSRFDPLP